MMYTYVTWGSGHSILGRSQLVTTGQFNSGAAEIETQLCLSLLQKHDGIQKKLYFTYNRWFLQVDKQFRVPGKNIQDLSILVLEFRTHLCIKNDILEMFGGFLMFFLILHGGSLQVTTGGGQWVWTGGHTMAGGWQITGGSQTGLQVVTGGGHVVTGVHFLQKWWKYII